MVPIDSAVEFPWLLNQGTATAMLGQREILPEFSHRTNLTAGGLPFLFWLKIQHRFYYSEYSVRLHGISIYVWTDLFPCVYMYIMFGFHCVSCLFSSVERVVQVFLLVTCQSKASN